MFSRLIRVLSIQFNSLNFCSDYFVFVNFLVLLLWVIQLVSGHVSMSSINGTNGNDLRKNANSSWTVSSKEERQLDFFIHILYDVCIYIYTYHIIFVLNLRILLFVCFCSGPATDDKHFRDCLFVVSTINLLSPGRNEKKNWWAWIICDLYSVNHPFLSDPGIPGVRPIIMPIGQSKAIWQCKLRNLVGNFGSSKVGHLVGTNASGATWTPASGNQCNWHNPWCKKHQLLGHIYKQCKLRHLEAKFTTNAHSATRWPKLELVQVTPSGG